MKKILECLLAIVAGAVVNLLVVLVASAVVVAVVYVSLMLGVGG